MKTTQSIQKMNFVNDTLSPVEAKELLEQLLDKHIQLCKLKSLSQWVGDHSADTKPIDMKMKDLNSRKQELNEIVLMAKEKGLSIDLGVNLELRFS
jgi:hypothetical protein